MRRLLRLLAAVLVVAVAAGGGFAAWLLMREPAPPRDLAGLEGDIARGVQVAHAGGCIGCHTPEDGPLFAGGEAIETDRGTFWGPNITPHETAGIGTWSLADFARALTAGRGPDGRRYYPAFPFVHYAKMTDQDIVDLWAALQTAEPADTTVPAPRLDFPWSVRRGLALWTWLHLEPGAFQADPDRSDLWNRGAYLVEGPAHCGACHTPRGWLGGRIEDRALGGSDLGPDITAGTLREAGWRVGDIAYALETGIVPDGDVLGGRMAEVIEHGTSSLPQADREAIGAYLLDRDFLPDGKDPPADADDG
jgi:mono/diheme cytochrome c family protein